MRVIAGRVPGHLCVDVVQLFPKFLLSSFYLDNKDAHSQSPIPHSLSSRLICHRFQSVITLDEQMRQLEDPSFCDFLTRARRATLTEDDATRLNSRVIRSLTDLVSEGATVIVKLNTLRHLLNRIRIENFARGSQKIYLFAAVHSRAKSTGPTNIRLQAHDLLLQFDHSAQILLSALLFYTQDMPTVMPTNACTPPGQVNGATGIIVGAVLDPAGKSDLIFDNAYLANSCS